MFVIVGLRNPGEEYENTRHNAGAIALDHFARTHNFPNLIPSQKYVADISEGTFQDSYVRLVFPNTYMNTSGTSVKKTLGKDDALMVVHDDVALGIGTFKISFDRGAGGNNGVESIIREIGAKDFVRIRIGISPFTEQGEIARPRGESLPDFVLKKFSKHELEILNGTLPRISDAIAMVISKGHESAMNAYN